MEQPAGKALPGKGSKVTDLYIVRHCETISNDLAVFAGHNDIDISERGSRQLACLSEAFQDIRLDKVYSSSRIRARKTADAINRYSQAPVVIDDAFIELYLGDWEGMKVADVPEDMQDAWYNHPMDCAAPNGETRDHCAQRGWEGLMRVVNENPEGTVAIASHGDVMRNVFRLLFRLPREDFTKVPTTRNTGINEVVFYSPAEWEIVQLDNVDHLPPDLVTAWKDKI